MSRAKRLTRKGRPRVARSITLPKLGGDHGTGTMAANANTELRALKNENGSNPNNMGQRQRVNVIDRLVQRDLLTMRQHQAANEIQEAYCRVQMLSSGSELKEQVQSSPKPDATIAVQIAAQSRYFKAMEKVRKSDREIIEHVCCLNLPVMMLARGRHAVRRYQRMRKTLDDVADHLGY